MVSVGPLGIIAFLVALGASGQRGQRTLLRLRSVAVRGLLVAAGLTVFAVLAPAQVGAIAVAVAFALATVSLPVWCYAALAGWLTRDDEHTTPVDDEATR